MTASRNPPAGGPGRECGFGELSRTLRGAFRAWEGGGGREWRTDFPRLALHAFRLQYRENPTYRRYCDARGADPASVDGWRRIPAVPTAAFRSVELVTGDPGGRPLAFRTSGTSRGEENRGTHVVRDPGLYRASAEAAFRRFVLEPPGLEPLPRARFCSLVPAFPDSEASSLSWMVDALQARFGASDPVYAAGPDGLDVDRATGAAEGAAGEDEPFCVLATTLALDEWTRVLEERGTEVRLPATARIMDTGGAKGRQGLKRGDVLRRVEERLGVPPTRVVNEFGMTELASQRYSTPGRDAHEPPDPGAGAPPVLHGPPWLRTRVLDPVSLEPRPEGDVGILCHFDLANLGSVCAVLTEDRGRVVGDGIQWMGRTGGAPPRGCSLATAELLEHA